MKTQKDIFYQNLRSNEKGFKKIYVYSLAKKMRHANMIKNYAIKNIN